MIELSYEESLTYNGKEGELAKITMLDGSTANAIYRGDEFVFLNKVANVDDNGIKMTMYDINKVAYAQLEALTDEQIQGGKELIENLHATYNNNYYMLYGKEISYFTLFAAEAPRAERLAAEAVECLSSLGAIVSIEQVNGAIEFWVVDENKTATALYLFPYDSGVIDFGG